VSRLADRIGRRFRAIWIASLAALLALAWINRFVQDDAFIVFRYASNFAHGHGLVYNPGEPVEGYTCFLWALLLGIGARLGLDPVPVSVALGLAAFAGSLAMMHRLATRLEGERRFGLAAMIVLGLNYTFSAFATGGLETSLHAFLVTAVLALGADELLAPSPGARRLIALSVLGALAILTRPDSPLLVAPLAIALVAARATEPRAPRGDARALFLIVPAALILGAWLAWKLRTYGDLLPNTFYAKATPGTSPARGINYVYRFVTSYWLEAPLVFALWCWRGMLASSVARILVLTLGLWIAYVIAIGGDFMEFRMFVPVLPILAWLIVRTARELERRARLGWALAAIVLVGSLQHALVYNHTSHLDRIESVWHLKSHLVTEEQNWIGIGRTLGREFGTDTSFTIATTAAGAIPYYSGLRTVDLCGLNDRWIARYGMVVGDVPGHQRTAPLDYLIERRVNLVIGHPRMVWDSLSGPIDLSEVPTRPWIAGARIGRTVPERARAIEIPIERGYRLRVLELTPNATLDRAIEAGHWPVREIIAPRP